MKFPRVLFHHRVKTILGHQPHRKSFMAVCQMAEQKETKKAKRLKGRQFYPVGIVEVLLAGHVSDRPVESDELDLIIAGGGDLL